MSAPEVFDADSAALERQQTAFAKMIRRNDALLRNMNGATNDREAREGRPHAKLRAKRHTLDVLEGAVRHVAQLNALGSFIRGQKEGRRRIRLALARTRKAIRKLETTNGGQHG